MRAISAVGLLVAGAMVGYVSGLQMKTAPPDVREKDSVVGLQMTKPIIVTITTREGSTDVTQFWKGIPAKSRSGDRVWTVTPLRGDEQVMTIVSGDYSMFCTVTPIATSRSESQVASGN